MFAFDDIEENVSYKMGRYFYDLCINSSWFSGLLIIALRQRIKENLGSCYSFVLHSVKNVLEQKLYILLISSMRQHFNTLQH
jgi:hypothetical protein